MAAAPANANGQKLAAAAAAGVRTVLVVHSTGEEEEEEGKEDCWLCSLFLPPRLSFPRFPHPPTHHQPTILAPLLSLARYGALRTRQTRRPGCSRDGSQFSVGKIAHPKEPRRFRCQASMSHS